MKMEREEKTSNIVLAVYNSQNTYIYYLNLYYTACK